MTQNNRSLIRNQKGFTLIEIIAVLVLLGILAAVAVPKYFDMQSGAKDKALAAMAANLSSASSSNYAAFLLKGSVGNGDNDPKAVANCVAVGALITPAIGSTDFVIAEDATGTKPFQAYTITDGGVATQKTCSVSYK